MKRKKKAEALRELVMETVDIIASGYEWVCPNCETLNDEIEVKEDVKCKRCGDYFVTNCPEHAIG